jgi:hypothetical protein
VDPHRSERVCRLHTRAQLPISQNACGGSVPEHNFPSLRTRVEAPYQSPTSHLSERVWRLHTRAQLLIAQTHVEAPYQSVSSHRSNACGGSIPERNFPCQNACACFIPERNFPSLRTRMHAPYQSTTSHLSDRVWRLHTRAQLLIAQTHV